MRTLHIVVTVVAIAGALELAADEPDSRAITSKTLAPDAVSGATYADFVPTRHPAGPWIHSAMPDGLVRKIGTALEIATQRLHDIPECAALFAPFGSDGLDLLAHTLYLPAGLYEQTTRCRHSFAITLVGGTTTWMCRKALFHSDERVAMALIHEALHHAGLPEYPQVPGAMLSGEINNLVMRSCDLR